jgi:hypothetical protein
MVVNEYGAVGRRNGGIGENLPRYNLSTDILQYDKINID